jgi:uncharacterized membrane protein YuzA (DUF378 family)
MVVLMGDVNPAHRVVLGRSVVLMDVEVVAGVAGQMQPALTQVVYAILDMLTAIVTGAMVVR